MHYHIRWSDSKVDWEHFSMREEAEEAARQLVLPGETFTLEPADDRTCVQCLGLETMWAPAWGYRDAAEYYQHESALGVVGPIRVPTLIVTAKDDPFIPFESFRHPAVVQNRFITLVAPERGGHCAFISPNGGSERFWAESLVVQFCMRHSALISEEETS